MLGAADKAEPTRVPLMPQTSVRARDLAFGVICLLLAVLAAATASWIPLAVLVIAGIVFVGRGLGTRRS
jgi:hypothetical protein